VKPELGILIVELGNTECCSPWAKRRTAPKINQPYALRRFGVGEP
jgi:hypothetical protein